MIKFNVILYDWNTKNIKSYDIIPYLYKEYKKCKDKPKSFEDIRKFIIQKSMYQWWSRCEYECIISSWPSDKEDGIKIDVFRQVMMNIDVITKLFRDEINKK